MPGSHSIVKDSRPYQSMGGRSTQGLHSLPKPTVCWLASGLHLSSLFSPAAGGGFQGGLKQGLRKRPFPLLPLQSNPSAATPFCKP